VKNQIKYSVYAMALAVALGVPNVASAGSDDRVRLRCDAEGVQDISMDAKFESRNGRIKFDASFEAQPGVGYSAGQTLDVKVGGVSVGRMTLFSIGDIVGDLNFDTTAQANDDDLLLPSGFPSVGEATSVMVGPLGCALQDD